MSLFKCMAFASVYEADADTPTDSAALGQPVANVVVANAVPSGPAGPSLGLTPLPPTPSPDAPVASADVSWLSLSSDDTGLTVALALDSSLPTDDTGKIVTGVYSGSITIDDGVDPQDITVIVAVGRS